MATLALRGGCARDSLRAASDWGKVLPSAEELVARLIGNKAKILRYAWIPQVLAGLFLLGLGYFMATRISI